MTSDLVGLVGELVLPTRGRGGPGEVCLTVSGSREFFLADSTEPLPRGAAVLVVARQAPRHVVVVPWPAPPSGQFSSENP